MKTTPPNTEESVTGPAHQEAGTINLVENERNMHMVPNPASYSAPMMAANAGMAMGQMGAPGGMPPDLMFRLQNGLPLSGPGMMPGMMNPYGGSMPPPIMPAPVPVPVNIGNPLMGLAMGNPALAGAAALGNLAMGGGCGCNAGNPFNLMPTGGCGCGQMPQ